MIDQNISGIIDNLHGDLESTTWPPIRKKKKFNLLISPPYNLRDCKSANNSILLRFHYWPSTNYRQLAHYSQAHTNFRDIFCRRQNPIFVSWPIQKKSGKTPLETNTSLHKPHRIGVTPSGDASCYY